MNKKQQNNQTTHQLAPPPKEGAWNVPYAYRLLARKESTPKLNNLFTRNLVYL